MTNLPQNANKSTYSDIRNLYDKKLIDALKHNQFSNIHDIIRAIKTIHQLENNKQIRWGKSQWEINLRKRLENTISRTIPNQLKLSASSIETYRQCPLKYRLSNIDKIPQVSS